MSFLTFKVEIDHGRIIVREPEKLPERASALLTILDPVESAAGLPRPSGLAQGEFVVPNGFNAPLPDELLRDFEGR